jgi:acyl carrier protein
MDALTERVRDIIAVELQIEPTKAVPTARLRGDLGMDSVAALNILFAIEEAFGLSAIDVTELANVATVDDVEALTRQHLATLRAS